MTRAGWGLAAASAQADADMRALRERTRTSHLQRSGIPRRVAAARPWDPLGAGDALLTREAMREQARARLEELRRRSDRAAMGLEDAPEQSEVDSAWSELEALSGANLLICGPSGTHKTHTAATIAMSALDRGLSVWMVGVGELAAIAKSRFGNDSSEDPVARARAVDLLVLDDLGKGSPSNWLVSDLLFRIVDGRYDDVTPTIVTTQCESADALASSLSRGGADLDGVQALLRRLLEGSLVLNTRTGTLGGTRGEGEADEG